MSGWGRNYGRPPRCQYDRVVRDGPGAGYKVQCRHVRGHRGDHHATLPSGLTRTTTRHFMWPAEPRGARMIEVSE